MSDETCYLYRAFCKDDVLLYIGIANNVEARLKQHNARSEWYDRMETYTTETYESRGLALEYEKEAIQKEKPTYNGTYNSEEKYNPADYKMVSIHKDLHRRLKFAAAMEDTTIIKLVAKILRKELD